MTDAIDLAHAKVYSSPPDIAAWPATVAITGITIRPQGSRDDGLAFSFSHALPEAWKWPSNPDVPSDNYQYTVWAFATIDGVWHGAAFIQMWQGRIATGAPPIAQFHSDWAYSSRFGPLATYSPKAGDQMAFLVSAGNGRDQTVVTSVRERSNVVLVTLPPNDAGAFTFEAAPVPEPQPVYAPPKVTPLTSAPSVDLSPVLLAKLDTLEADIARLRAEVKDFRELAMNDLDRLADAKPVIYHNRYIGDVVPK